MNYITGEGWTSVKQGTSLESKAKINAFLESINEDESLDELTEKICLDFELFDGFALEVIKTKNKKGYQLNSQ